MLPKSSESASGAISVWQWVKMGWNYKSTPAFNPLQVFLLTFTCLPGIFDIGLQIIKSKCKSNCKSSPLLRNIKDFNITKRLLAVPVVPYFASKIKMLANLLSILSFLQIQHHFSLNWAFVSVNFYWLFFTHSALSLVLTWQLFNEMGVCLSSAWRFIGVAPKCKVFWILLVHSWV